MSEESNAPEGGGGEAISVITPAADTPEHLSINEAAKALADLRWSKKQPKAQAPAEEPAVETQEELSDEDNAAPPEEATGEEPEAVEPEETLPPLDPPRSWTKAEQERFRTLPRETQEYLHQRETERDREVRRTQNETAEKLKGLTAKEQEIAKLQQEYEAKLPALMQSLQDAQAGSFSDIKTMDDVTRLSVEDPFRFQQWQVHQMKLQAVNAELEQSKQRQAQEKSTSWQKHVGEENTKAAELIPELADPVKSKALQSAAVDLLHDKGFTDQELNRLASGEDKISIYDHRLQSLLLDGVRFRDAQKAPSKAVSPQVPPVQKPGAAAPKGSSATDRLQALKTAFERDPTLANAQALRVAQMKQPRRSA